MLVLGILLDQLRHRACSCFLCFLFSFQTRCRGEPKDVMVMDSKGYGFVSFIEMQDAFRFLEVGPVCFSEAFAACFDHNC